jgi:signal transduction histidine kinase/ligand-binding sensor domain-containing protein/CheY-like chemotaxis protein
VRFRVAYALLCLVLLSAEAYAQRYSFKYYDRESGLPSQGVHTLLQDRTGFLWIGTESGLYRYDGRRYRAFSVAEGLPDSEVRAIHQSNDGTLWAATPRGLARLRGERFEAVDISPGIGANAVNSDARGRLYVGLSSGLLVMTPPQGGTGKPTSTLYTVPQWKSQKVRSIAVSAAGSVWYTCGPGLCRLEDGRAVPAAGVGVADDLWYAVLFDHEGNLWARSRTRLIELPKGEGRFLRRDDGLPQGFAGTLYVGRDGQLWVPTVRGLARHTAAGWETVGKSRGLPLSSVTCALEDREGSMWIGTWGGGVARWLGYPYWDQWTETEGLSSEAIWGITRDAAGVLWASNDAGVSRFDEIAGRWRDLRLRGLPAAVTEGMAWASDGSLWLAQGTAAVHADLRRGVAATYGKEAGFENNWTSTVAVDHENRVWAGTTDGLYLAVSRAGSLRFERQTLPSERDPELVDTSLVDRKGRLWVGGSGGLLRFEAGRWTRFTTADGLLHERVSKLAEALDGSLWISYADAAGVSQLTFDGQRPRWRHLSNKDGLRAGSIYFIGCDRDGRIWFGGDQGVDVLDDGRWRHLDRTDGLIWDDTNSNAFWADADGSVWIGTSRGISHLRIPSSGLPARPSAAPVLLTAAALGGSNVGLGTAISVPWARRSLTVGFAALTFVNEDTVRFRYRIAGLDERWTETQLREAHFPSLPAGSYTFEVQSNTGQGAWLGTPARLAFAIRPAWWRSWWSDLGAGAALVLLARLVWYWRVHAILRRQKVLKHAVADRTLSLNLEKARAESERDKVARQKVEIEHLLREVRLAAGLKDQFLCNISHEIRTPMNGIIGMTELALDTTLSAEQREYLLTVRSSSAALLGILNEILDLSAIEAGKTEVELSVFDLPELVSAAMRNIELEAHRKNLEAQSSIGPGLPRLLIGDPVHLRRVLVNLLNNAVKFTEQGRVSLRVELEEATEGPLLHFTVADTGIGIAAEDQALIFEPFSQVDGSHTRRYGGPGLGLTVSARFVALMNGRIWIESTPGGGSRFHFTAPFRSAPDQAELSISGSTDAPGLNALATAVEAEPSPAEAPGAGNPPQNSNSLCILLAEDNPVNQKLACRLLNKRGYEVVIADNGIEALAAMERRRFDLVLMDIQMPEMGGFEATAQIRAREQQSGGHIPVIAFTAHALEGDRERCLEVGMDDYITKPIQPALLFAAIERQRNRAFQQPPTSDSPVSSTG